MAEVQGYLFGEPFQPKPLHLAGLVRRTSDKPRYLFKGKRIPATEGLVRRSDPRTSREAAQAIAPVSGLQRQAILAALRSAGARGLTAAEIDSALQASWPNPGTRTPRIAELQISGHVRDSGETRPSPSGRRMIVWVAT